MSSVIPPLARWPPDYERDQALFYNERDLALFYNERDLALLVGRCWAKGGVPTAPPNIKLISHFKSRSIEGNCFFSPAVTVSLSDFLAFFTYIDCDPNHILSLSIFDTGNNQLLVIVGINSGEYGHNAELLNTVCRRFQYIFRVLHRLHIKEIRNDEAFKAIFEAVVSLNFVKITSHLWLSPACFQPPEGHTGMTSDLKCLKTLVEESILKRLKTVIDAGAHVIDAGAHGLQPLYDNLAAILISPREPASDSPLPLSKLYDVLHEINRFVTEKGDNYDSFFDNLPIRNSSDIDIITAVKQRLKYLSCYVGFSAALCNLAVGNISCGDYPDGKVPPQRSWTEAIEVVAAPMTKDMYTRSGCEVPITKDELPISNNRKRNPCSRYAKPKQNCFCEKCTREETLEKANQGLGLKPDKNNDYVTAKIHAESFVCLEILRRNDYQTGHKFYIASSKKPCTYCARFMAHLGCFYSQMSHGKTYYGWRLPSLEYMHRRFTPCLQANLDGLFTALDQSAANPNKLHRSGAPQNEELELRNGPFCRAAFIPGWCPETGAMMTNK